MTRQDFEADAKCVEVRLFASYVLGLWPGHHVRVVDNYSYNVGDLARLGKTELQLLVDEGRRQHDQQLQQLEQVRGRGQFLLTTALALMAFAVPLVRDAFDFNMITGFLTVIALLLFSLGTLGAAAVVVAKKLLAAIDVAELSGMDDFSLAKLAEEYAKGARTNENTRTSTITVFRDAVLLVLGGSLAWGIAWLLVSGT